ncbi:uncharacterized protein HD556DRAFT_61549 [Suillus plorans]|uniref:Uncharacterized protein n=1 Tax=Suillus plorans TaxID=116603 RepID=A0A9P7DP99_9AGAM|nr:uncharacterized protein HD556DRAFT_61549 [Suillus plorans]KAG1799733.1 hypothetical protein HD556DRAFT_61549 [Suillus plorans]
MQESTASPSAAVQSTDNDCIASQLNPIKQTTAQTHTLIRGRAGCPVVLVYEVGTDWLTVSCLINDHSSVCKGGFHGLSHSPPRCNTQDAQHMLSPPQLENDEYTEDVRPISVRCRGCQKAISLDKSSRYYPRLWIKHRGKYPGILKIEAS